MVREPSKTKKKDEPNRKVVVDGVEEGSWSATGSVVQIHSTKETNRKAIIGSKRVLTYKSARSASSSLKIVHAENEGKNIALLDELEEHPLLVLHPYVRSNGSLDVF